MADDIAAAVGTKKSGSRFLQIAVVSGLMVAEGAAVYFVSRGVGTGPAAAVALEGKHQKSTSETDELNLVEVELADSRPSNKQSGRFITFHLRVSGLVAPEDEQTVKDLAAARQARILDRVNYVVRSADLLELNEPGLETLKRRLLKEFQSIFGDEDLIRSVLIPELLQSGPGI